MSALRLSRHAWCYTSEGPGELRRTSLSPSEVLEILDKKLTVPIGFDKIKRRHELFFIVDDDKWLVAVINTNISEVVTLLPPQWHNRWRISEGAKQAARDIAIAGHNDIPIPSESRSDENVFVQALSRKAETIKIGGDCTHRFLVYACIDNHSSQKLLSWEFDHEPNVVEFMMDEAVYKAVAYKIWQLNLPVDRITSVLIRKTRKDPGVVMFDDIFHKIIGLSMSM